MWRDTADLWPGEDWRTKIRLAITDNALVFIACFSSQSTARVKSYQREELALATDQLRLRRPDDPWLIPVRFDDCPVPDLDLGTGRTLSSIQGADLFGNRREAQMTRLLTVVQRLLGQPGRGPRPRGQGMKARVLVVEDDQDISLGIRTALDRSGFDVVSAADGKEGLRAFHAIRPDLVVLNIQLDGWAMLEHIRVVSDVPVLILSAHGTEADKVRGLHSGADDYLTMPFSNREPAGGPAAAAEDRLGAAGGLRRRRREQAV